MATMDESAAFFSGRYMGWARQPEWPDWEDLIGSVEVKCLANKRGPLDVTITSLEFGTWTGSLKPQDGVMEGSTGQKGTYFKFTFHESGQADDAQGRFIGGIYKHPTELLLELSLTKL